MANSAYANTRLNWVDTDITFDATFTINSWSTPSITSVTSTEVAQAATYKFYQRDLSDTVDSVITMRNLLIIDVAGSADVNIDVIESDDTNGDGIIDVNDYADGVADFIVVSSVDVDEAPVKGRFYLRAINSDVLIVPPRDITIIAVEAGTGTIRSRDFRIQVFANPTFFFLPALNTSGYRAAENDLVSSLPLFARTGVDRVSNESFPLAHIVRAGGSNNISSAYWSYNGSQFINQTETASSQTTHKFIPGFENTTVTLSVAAVGGQYIGDSTWAPVISGDALTNLRDCVPEIAAITIFGGGANDVIGASTLEYSPQTAELTAPDNLNLVYCEDGHFFTVFDYLAVTSPAVTLGVSQSAALYDSNGGNGIGIAGSLSNPFNVIYYRAVAVLMPNQGIPLGFSAPLEISIDTDVTSLGINYNCTFVISVSGGVGHMQSSFVIPNSWTEVSSENSLDNYYTGIGGLSNDIQSTLVFTSAEVGSGQISITVSDGSETVTISSVVITFVELMNVISVNGASILIPTAGTPSSLATGFIFSGGNNSGVRKVTGFVILDRVPAASRSNIFSGTADALTFTEDAATKIGNSTYTVIAGQNFGDVSFAAGMSTPVVNGDPDDTVRNNGWYAWLVQDPDSDNWRLNLRCINTDLIPSSFVAAFIIQDSSSIPVTTSVKLNGYSDNDSVNNLRLLHVYSPLNWSFALNNAVNQAGRSYDAATPSTWPIIPTTPYYSSWTESIISENSGKIAVPARLYAHPLGVGKFVIRLYDESGHTFLNDAVGDTGKITVTWRDHDNTVKSYLFNYGTQLTEGTFDADLKRWARYAGAPGSSAAANAVFPSQGQSEFFNLSPLQDSQYELNPHTFLFVFTLASQYANLKVRFVIEHSTEFSFDQLETGTSVSYNPTTNTLTSGNTNGKYGIFVTLPKVETVLPRPNPNPSSAYVLCNIPVNDQLGFPNPLPFTDFGEVSGDPSRVFVDSLDPSVTDVASLPAGSKWRLAIAKVNATDIFAVNSNNGTFAESYSMDTCSQSFTASVAGSISSLIAWASYANLGDIANSPFTGAFVNDIVIRKKPLAAEWLANTTQCSGPQVLTSPLRWDSTSGNWLKFLELTSTSTGKIINKASEQLQLAVNPVITSVDQLLGGTTPNNSTDADRAASSTDSSNRFRYVFLACAENSIKFFTYIELVSVGEISNVSLAYNASLSAPDMVSYDPSWTIIQGISPTVYDFVLLRRIPGQAWVKFRGGYKRDPYTISHFCKYLPQRASFESAYSVSACYQYKLEMSVAAASHSPYFTKEAMRSSTEVPAYLDGRAVSPAIGCSFPTAYADRAWSISHPGASVPAARYAYTDDGSAIIVQKLISMDSGGIYIAGNSAAVGTTGLNSEGGVAPPPSLTAQNNLLGVLYGCPTVVVRLFYQGGAVQSVNDRSDDAIVNLSSQVLDHCRYTGEMREFSSSTSYSRVVINGADTVMPMVMPPVITALVSR